MKVLLTFVIAIGPFLGMHFLCFILNIKYRSFGPDYLANGPFCPYEYGPELVNRLELLSAVPGNISGSS